MTTEFNPYDWKLHEDPYPVYRALRDDAPAYRNEELDFWALSRHADVLAALRDPGTWSSAEGVALERLDRAATEVSSFLAMDPPRHDDLRRTVWRRFTKRATERLEPTVRSLAERYLAELRNAGRGDFIGDFAARVPMDVIGEMMGVPAEDRGKLRGWADAVVHRDELSPDIPPAAFMAAGRMLRYFADHVSSRRREPAEDLTTTLIEAEIDGEPIKQRDIISLHFLLAIAGNETTTKLLGNAVHWLWRNPDQRRLVREDPARITGWVEETLRYDASSQMVARTVTRDVELHDQTIPEGSRVALLLGSANRDERAFEDADTYDIGRNISQTLAFGHGVHYCLGASLARLEGRVCLEELMRIIPDFEIQTDQVVRVHSPNVRGFASMPIEVRA